MKLIKVKKMQTKNTKINKLVIGTLLATSAVIFSTSGLAVNPKLRVYASASQTSVSIDNSSFTSGSTKPSSWTSISSLNSTVIASVVDTNSEEFEENKDDYGITVNPGKVLNSSDSKIFMINSKDIAVSYGYKSNNFTLASNGYYVIKVPVRTQNSAWASVYLVDENNNFKLQSENITTTGSYKTYEFYVATQSTSLDVNLQLYLGSETNVAKGAVFFDEITAYSYNESAFYDVYEQRNQSTSVSYIPSKITYSWSSADNSELEKLSEDGYNASADGFIQKVYSLQVGTVYPEGVTNPTDANLENNSDALLLKNKTESSL